MWDTYQSGGSLLLGFPFPAKEQTVNSPGWQTHRPCFADSLVGLRRDESIDEWVRLWACDPTEVDWAGCVALCSSLSSSGFNQGPSSIPSVI